MKRSEINDAIHWAEGLLQKYSISLPFFARLAESAWSDSALAQVKHTMLGWDVTDFGRNEFQKVGAVPFTVRNGDMYHPEQSIPYCEKYIFLKDGCEQEIPMHYHIFKSEDIINRAGGILCVEVAGRTEDDLPDFSKPIEVVMDGVHKTIAPGTVIEIQPGNSITLTPYMYHRFYAKTGAGDLVVGEVSKVNDDHKDNIFSDKTARFCVIDEDEPKYRLLVNEYPA